MTCLLATSSLQSASETELYQNAKQKVEAIARNQARRGSTTTLSVGEINALVKGKLKEDGVEGVRNPKVVLAEDRGTWSGIVNFEKLPQLESLRNNFLLSSILKGESPISATMKLTSAGGKATIDVEQVMIGATKFEGSTLGFLVERLVLSDYPDAKLGEPFELEHNVEQIKLTPEGVRIKIKD